MGVGSQIDPSSEDSAEVAYRQLKKLVDEPSPSGSREKSCKPSLKLKIGMRPVGKKGSKSRIIDSRVYFYDELIEYRPRREDSDDDNFRFNVEDIEMEF